MTSRGRHRTSRSGPGRVAHATRPLHLGGNVSGGTRRQMERRSTTHRTLARIRIVGFMLGMAFAATVVGASRIPAGAGVLGAYVAIGVAPPRELAVKHSGRVLAG